MFRTISMQQLEYLLDGERTFTLMDVREQKEYEAGHLLGAVNLPYERLAEVEAKVLTARELAGRGYDAVNALGGLHYYRGKYYVKCRD